MSIPDSYKYFAYLQISSWSGISVGAEHYYGELRGCDESGKHQTVELRKIVTREDARLLNKKDNSRDYARFCGNLWKVGETTHRFNTEEEIRKIAKKEWKKYFPQAQVLIEGSSSTVEPQPILVAPADYKRKVNGLAKKAEEIDYWEGDEKEMQRLCDEWNSLNKKYFRIWNNKA